MDDELRSLQFYVLSFLKIESATANCHHSLMEIDRLAMQDRQVIVDFQRDMSNRSCRSKIEDVMRTEVNSSVIP